MPTVAAKKPNLPRWAQVLPPRFEVPKLDALDLVEEETFLRTQCCQALYRQVDKATHEALEALCQPVLNALDHMVQDSTIPWTEDDTDLPVDEVRSSEASPRKRARLLEDEWYRNLAVEPPSRYDPLLLPLLHVQGPWSGLDRYELMRHVVQTRKHTRNRSATVWLQPPTVQRQQPLSSHHWWVEEITRQCLLQESALPDLLQNPKSQQQLSLTERLVAWASTTDSFDNIVVFCQVEDNAFYQTAWQDFLQWIASRRLHDGLPFVCVLLGPHPDRRPIPWRSQGALPIWVESCSFPTARKILQCTLDNLHGNPNYHFCLPLKDSLAKFLEYEFRDIHGSAVRLLSLLKQIVAHGLTIKGSFLGVPREALQDDERRRLAWFQVDCTARNYVWPEDGSARSVVEWQCSFEQHRLQAAVARQVMSLIHPSTIFPMLSKRNLNLGFGKALDGNTRREILQLLVSYRSISKIPDMHTILNTVIVLVDRCTYPNEILQCVEGLHNDWINTFDAKFGGQTRDEVILSSLMAQFRRHTVVAMLSNLVEYDCLTVENISCRLPSLLMQHIRNRISIPQQEWFDGFCVQSRSLAVDRQEIFELFICGVNFLKMQGLVRERKAFGRDEVVYDKATLVWCSGD
jgi:hypothetical protein